jgi:1-aminocyclopropane-1-carboxylate deaminase
VNRESVLGVHVPSRATGARGPRGLTAAGRTAAVRPQQRERVVHRGGGVGPGLVRRAEERVHGDAEHGAARVVAVPPLVGAYTRPMARARRGETAAPASTDVTAASIRGAGITLRLPSPLVELVDDRLGDVRLLLKRDDLIHGELTGNKWRKLKYVLADARSSGASTLLTFGGAYSNHLRAVAAAGRLYGFSTIGVVRGEERPYNPVLASAVADGMRLHYLDRASYRRKSDPDVVDALRRSFGDFYPIPEGGTTTLAVQGCAELVGEIDEPFDVITCPVGTGGTLAGLSAGLGPGRRALGISVLKGALSLDDEVAQLQRAAIGRVHANWTIDHRFHCGGFARRSPLLDEFLEGFASRHGLRLDPVYVGKMMLGLFTLISQGVVPAGTTVVAVVTGGPSDGSG